MKSGAKAHVLLPRRHYVIGDIHGCIDELKALEAKLTVHALKSSASPFFIAAGDLIDRGPDSAAVLRHIRAGIKAGTHAAVLGNHEQMLMEIFEEFAPNSVLGAGVALPRILRSYRQRHRESKKSSRHLSIDDYLQLRRLLWIAEGGGATLASFGCNPSDVSTWCLPPEDLRFLATLPLVWENEAMVVTHALCDADSLAAARAHVAGAGAEPELHQALSILWNRQLPKVRVDPTKWHVSGHTVTRGVKVRGALGCVQVDSGCVFGGRLSAWCVETRTMVSVKGRSL